MARFKIKDGILWNDKGMHIAVMTDDVSEEEEKILEACCEVMESVQEFVESGGRIKPKKAYDNFKLLLDKYEIA